MNEPTHYAKSVRALDEAAGWANADTGWKGTLSPGERVARQTADAAVAQAEATLAVADGLRLLAEAVNAGVGEAEALRAAFDDRLSEVRDQLDALGSSLDMVSGSIDGLAS